MESRLRDSGPGDALFLVCDVTNEEDIVVNYKYLSNLFSLLKFPGIKWHKCSMCLILYYIEERGQTQ